MKIWVLNQGIPSDIGKCIFELKSEKDEIPIFQILHGALPLVVYLMKFRTPPTLDRNTNNILVISKTYLK